MADSSRIEDLRRRVQKDPASIAFAQLAEELRRARRFDDSIETCRAGLGVHPGYLSARVTLGRALIETGQLGDAQTELEHVLASAPENLAAIRGLAEINHRNGDLAAALSHYRAALALAKNDPDLQETVSDLAKQIEPPKPPAEEGLTLEQMAHELSLHRPPPVPVDAPTVDFFDTPAAADPPAVVSHTASDAAAPDFAAEPSSPIADPVAWDATVESTDSAPREWLEPLGDPVASATGEQAASSPDPQDPHATRMIAALEHWLEAIHVTRDQRGA